MSNPNNLSSFREFPDSIEEQRMKWADLANEDLSDDLPTCKPEILNLKIDSEAPACSPTFALHIDLY